LIFKPESEHVGGVAQGHKFTWQLLLVTSRRLA